MNKEEAEKEVERWKEERMKVFCPLIKDRCKLDCMCLVSKSILEYEKDEEYGTLGGYCSCYMLQGYEMM